MPIGQPTATSIARGIYGVPPDELQFMKASIGIPIRAWSRCRSTSRGQAIHIETSWPIPNTGSDCAENWRLSDRARGAAAARGHADRRDDSAAPHCRPFTEKQIELVATFADQAVIAIENVRLFDEVQARTRDLSEALEQQTATSEVLRVISSSPGEWSPYFRLCWRAQHRLARPNLDSLYQIQGDSDRIISRLGITLPALANT